MRRLGARAGEADALQARHRLAQQLGQLGVQLVLVGAGGAARQRRLDRLAHARVAVAQQRGAVAAAQVDVLLAVEVPDAGSRRRGRSTWRGRGPG